MSDETGAPPSPLEILLSRLVELDGTDLFLTHGAPAVASVNKKFVALMDRPLNKADLERAIAPFLEDPEKAAAFARKPDMDLAHFLPGKGRFRINLYRQRNEIALVARRVKLKIPSFEELNLPQILARFAMERKGLCLVTGATGSGKSSTLAAMIDHRNRSAPGHILTIEDPIEFVHEHKQSIVSQREVGVDTQRFQDALKSALRQAPDVLLIGEIRDLETAEASLELAETGHLVFATLHAANASQTLERVINLFPTDARPAMQMLMSLNMTGIIAQRLVPSRATGGRVAAFEILVPTPRVRDLVRDGQIDVIRDAMAEGGSEGMQTFDMALYHLVRQNKLTLAEAIPFAESANDLKLKFTLQSAGDASAEQIKLL